MLRLHDLDEFTLVVGRPQAFQLDGDYLGERDKVQFHIRPGSTESNLLTLGYCNLVEGREAVTRSRTEDRCRKCQQCRPHRTILILGCGTTGPGQRREPDKRVVS